MRTTFLGHYRMDACLILSLVFVVVFNSACSAEPVTEKAGPSSSGDEQDIPAEVQQFFDRWIGVKAPELGPNAQDRSDGPPILLASFSGKRILLFAFDAGNFVDAPNEEKLLNTLKDLDEVRAEVGSDETVVIGFTEGTLFTWPGVVTPEPFKSLSDFPIVNTTNREFNEPYNLLSYPSGITIDESGIITQIHLSPMSKEDIRNALSGPKWDQASRPIPVEEPWKVSGPPRPTMNPVQVWSKPHGALLGICPGDWNQDGSTDLIAVSNEQEAVILSATGETLGRFPVEGVSNQSPLDLQWGVFANGESGLIHHRGGWPKDVPVIDSTGKVLWRYPESIPMGVNSVALSDLDDDGLSEMLMGFNGPGFMGGFHLISASGEEIWRQDSVGNVWKVVGIAAKDGRPGLAICTNSGENIQIFDAGGSHVGTVEAEGKFISDYHAAEMNPAGLRQLLTVRKATVGTLDLAVATDLEGKFLWQYPVDADQLSKVPWSILTADLTGDGTDEWIIYPKRGEVVALDVGGNLIARYERPETGWRCWGVLPRNSNPALLVFGGSDHVTAFGLEAIVRGE